MIYTPLTKKAIKLMYLLHLDEHYQTIAFEELDMIIGKFEGATTYMALNTIDKIPKSEKKTLERVFNVIQGMEIDNADAIIDEAINGFSAV